MKYQKNEVIWIPKILHSHSVTKHTYHPYDGSEHSGHTTCTDPALTYEPQTKLAQHRLVQLQTQNHQKHCHGSGKNGSHQELGKYLGIVLSAGL
jgi:hypothetical protein